MRDMDLKVLQEVGTIFPDPEPETQQSPDTRIVEEPEQVTKKRRTTK